MKCHNTAGTSLTLAEMLTPPRSWREPADPWSNRRYHPFRDDPYWRRVSSFPSTRARPQVARPDPKGFREGGWELPTTTSAHWWHAVCFHVWTQHLKRHIHCTPVTKKFPDVNKTLYMACVDLEKAFDRVPRCVIWWTLRKLGIKEWLVQLKQSMYEKARSRLCVGCNMREEFSVKVGVHQGSCLSPLLFIMVLETLS